MPPLPARRRHNLSDILARADEFAARAESYEPSPTDETTTPEMLARRIDPAWCSTAIFDALDLDNRPITVTHCRHCGKTWADCGATITEHTHQETT